MRNVKEVLNVCLRFILSAGILFFIFSKIDIKNTIGVIKTADLRYVLTALLVFLSIHGLLLLRWSIFMKAMKLQFRIFTAARYFFIGLFGNLFLPTAIGGDIVKTVGLARETHNKTAVIASVILDRLSGFVAIVIVASTAFVLGFGIIRNIYIGIPVLILALVSLVIGFMLFNEKVYSFGCRIFNKLPKIKKALMDMHKDVLLIKKNPVKGWMAVGLSCMSQTIYAFSFYYCAKALHQDISIIYFLIFVPLICVVCSLPSIGGLGVREAGTAYFFSKIGVDPGIAVSMSLMNFLFMVIAGSIGGVILVMTGFKLSEAVNPKEIEGETII